MWQSLHMKNNNTRRLEVQIQPEQSPVYPKILKSMRAAVGQFSVYHKTLGACIAEVERYADSVGAVMEEGIFWTEQILFCGGVSYGTTKSFSWTLTSYLGKNTRKGLQVQIYRMDSGTYELNIYAL